MIDLTDFSDAPKGTGYRMCDSCGERTPAKTLITITMKTPPRKPMEVALCDRCKNELKEEL